MLPSRAVRGRAVLTALLLALAFGCSPPPQPVADADPKPAVAVGDSPTSATSADGHFISWREHIVDDTQLAGVEISGSDGLATADLDLDGFLDVVSVHESDTTYDGVADGRIRIAFGSGNPRRWSLTTLAEGEEAGAAEDVAIADVDGDGFPDVMAACELAHLIYFQNPGSATEARAGRWPRLVLPMTVGRGSYIRVFLADLDGDGRPEAVAPNKGAQNPPWETTERHPISVFSVAGDPLEGASWREHELGRYVTPRNSQPVDLDGDGDLDVVGGARGEGRIFWLENRTGIDTATAGTAFDFAERPIALDAGDGEQTLTEGFHLAFADLDGDARLDIVTQVATAAADGAPIDPRLAWLQQPASPDDRWRVHRIGTFAPDTITGFVLADIDGDGDLDAFGGSYSGGPRDHDGAEVTAGDRLGRLGWFEQSSDPASPWRRHDVSRRKRGMFDQFVAHDLDRDGDVDLLSTRGNSAPWDGVFWLEQVRSESSRPAFERAREADSAEMPLPAAER